MNTVTKSTVWEQTETVRLLTGAPGTQYQEADETNQAIIRDWVRRLLYTNQVQVQFVKSDGTLREMNCTLRPDLIPPATHTLVESDIVNASRKPRKEPDVHSIRVYDIDIGEWRSFRFDRLKRITASLSFE